MQSPVVHQWIPYIFLILIIPYTVWLAVSRTQKNPPGPQGLPIIGNTHQAPRPFSWKWYEELRSMYGRIFRLRVLGDNFIILNDPKVAEDILGRRSLNYASRKFLPFAGHHRSGDKRMILMPYGEEFKKQRAAMQLLFRPQSVTSNRRRQEQQAKKFLFNMLTTPADFAMHLKRFSGGIALGVAFGMSVEKAELETPTLMANTENIGGDLFPGLWMADMFPFLNKLPDLLAPWRAVAIAKHKQEVSLFARFAEEEQPGAVEASALAAQIRSMQPGLELDEASILYICGSVGEAGTNTTACAIHCFLLACTLKPNVVARAQAELDRVVGDRPPAFSDYLALPYVWAVVKEVLRWIPVTPLSFPHLATQADEYDGYRIEAGSQVVASIWNMHRDPEVFSNPEVFDPERWFEPTAEGKLREDASLFDGIWTFGFGRRSCPGKRLAVDSVWIGIAHLLWALNITDADPEKAAVTSMAEVDKNLTWRDAVNIEPLKLDLRITPRSSQKASKIREEWEAIKSA